MKSVVQPLEQTVLKVHVSDGVDALGEVHASWQLTVSGGPLVLDALHVPLVDHGNNALLRAAVDVLEEILVSLVDEDALVLWEVDVESLDVPVNQVGVQALLGELMRLRIVKTGDNLLPFILVELEAIVPNSPVDVVWQVLSGLVEESAPGCLVKLWSQEVGLGSEFLSFLTGELDLKTWLQEMEVAWDPVVELEASSVEIEPGPEQQRSGVLFPQVKAAHPGIPV